MHGGTDARPTPPGGEAAARRSVSMTPLAKFRRESSLGYAGCMAEAAVDPGLGVAESAVSLLREAGYVCAGSVYEVLHGRVMSWGWIVVQAPHGGGFAVLRGLPPRASVAGRGRTALEAMGVAVGEEARVVARLSDRGWG